MHAAETYAHLRTVRARADGEGGKAPLKLARVWRHEARASVACERSRGARVGARAAGRERGARYELDEGAEGRRGARVEGAEGRRGARVEGAEGRTMSSNVTPPCRHARPRCTDARLDDRCARPGRTYTCERRGRADGRRAEALEREKKQSRREKGRRRARGAEEIGRGAGSATERDGAQTSTRGQARRDLLRLTRATQVKKVADKGRWPLPSAK